MKAHLTVLAAFVLLLVPTVAVAAGSYTDWAEPEMIDTGWNKGITVSGPWAVSDNFASVHPTCADSDSPIRFTRNASETYKETRAIIMMALAKKMELRFYVMGCTGPGRSYKLGRQVFIREKVEE